MAWNSTTQSRAGQAYLRDGVKSLTLTYRVYFTSTSDAPVDALSAPQIPAMGDPYPGDSTLRVVSKDATALEDNPTIFDVVVIYSTGEAGGPGGGEEDPPNPLDLPAVISYGYAESTVPAKFTVDDLGAVQLNAGDAIVNSAGDPFDPPPERLVFDTVFTIRKNRASLNVIAFDVYQGAVNSDTWSGFAPGTCRLRMTATEETSQGIDFYAVEYQVTVITNTGFTDDAQDLHLVDEGFRYIDSEGDKVEVLDDRGEKATVPALLNGSGGLATGYASGATVIVPTILDFQVDRHLPFAAFPVPEVT